mmetsp:Transcript_47558/g.93852  ORF Transcript_47558/g.93852 Transcript_47558/m.93852 type:complete len:424 (+) Transcript_47558:390-1661(+)
MELLKEFKSSVCTELAQITSRNYKMDLSPFFDTHTNVAQEITKFRAVELSTIEKALNSFTQTGIGRDFCLLLRAGADVEGMGRASGGSATLGKRLLLSKAVSQGNVRAMRMLLEDGGAVVQTSAPNQTICESAVAASSSSMQTESLVEKAVSTGNLEAVKVLVHASGKNLIRPRVFERAVSEQRWRIFRYLLKVSRPQPHESGDAPTPPLGGRAENWEGGSLIILCSAPQGPGRLEAAALLVQEGANVHRIAGGRGVTLLHKAAFRGLVGLVRLLLDWGVDKEAVDVTGKSALTYTVRGLQQEVVELLLTLGADVNERSRNNQGAERLTPLHQIGHGGCGFDEGVTAPSYGPEDQAIAEVLVRWGAEVEALDSQGRSALHRAAEYGSLELVEYLIDRGADAGRRDDEDALPLHWACESRPPAF